jgi:hypothetical protein
LNGHWSGTIKLPDQVLPFQVDFRGKAGAWAGEISSAPQNINHLPLTTVVARDDSIWFTTNLIPGVPSFAGVFSPDGRAISGGLTQHGALFSF